MVKRKVLSDDMPTYSVYVFQRATKLVKVNADEDKVETSCKLRALHGSPQVERTTELYSWGMLIDRSTIM